MNSYRCMVLLTQIYKKNKNPIHSNVCSENMSYFFSLMTLLSYGFASSISECLVKSRDFIMLGPCVNCLYLAFELHLWKCLNAFLSAHLLVFLFFLFQFLAVPLLPISFPLAWEKSLRGLSLSASNELSRAMIYLMIQSKGLNWDVGMGLHPPPLPTHTPTPTPPPLNCCFWGCWSMPPPKVPHPLCGW